MVPVDHRVVETGLQPLVAKSLYHWREQIALGRGVRRFIVGQRRIPQTEAIVVLGRHHKVLHPRVLRLLRPGRRVVEIRVKVVEIFLIILVSNQLAVLDPLVARRQGVDAPVDKESKTVVGKPTAVSHTTTSGL